MRHALLLFAVALSVRLCFWQATADRDWPCAVAYEGDAVRWQQLVAPDAAAVGDWEAILPFRPPAMTWLVRALGDGAPTARADLGPRDWVPAAPAARTRLLLAVLGAAIAPLLFLLLRRDFSARVALFAGWICVFATGLVLLGSGVHCEIPCLFLFLLSLFDWQRLGRGPAPFAAARWGALQALASLFRADHLLVVALQLAWLCRKRGPGRLRNALVAVAALGLALLPRQLHAWSTIAAYDHDHAPALPLPSSLPWDAAALAAVRALPAFAQLATFRFVDATVRVRGGARVREGDLAVLDEAYDARPEPLAVPLIALYGPLNFFLGNSPESDGGFTRAALDRAPPLRGGPSRYPPNLVLPRGLAFDYPPHAQIVNHGYRLGLLWLAAHPGSALALCWRKLCYGWQGAATGVGSHALPIGLSGTRRPVDMVTADGAAAAIWRGLLLLLALAGLFAARRQPAAAVFAIWLLAKVITLLAFFGYARLGALCIPALALFWALALERWLLARLPAGWPARLGLALAALLALLELVRVCAPPAPTLDGVPIGPTPGRLVYETARLRY